MEDAGTQRVGSLVRDRAGLGARLLGFTSGFLSPATLLKVPWLSSVGFTLLEDPFLCLHHPHSSCKT